MTDWLPELPPAPVSLIVYRVGVTRALVGLEDAPADRAAWFDRCELVAAGVAEEDIASGCVVSAVLPDPLAARFGA